MISLIVVLFVLAFVGSYWGGSFSLHPAVPSSQSTDTP